MERILDSQAKAEYFRHAGLGAAIRYTLGLPQSPQHLRYLMQTRPVTGLNPPVKLMRPAAPDPGDELFEATRGSRVANREVYRRYMDTSDLRRATP